MAYISTDMGKRATRPFAATRLMAVQPSRTGLDRAGTDAKLRPARAFD